MRNPQARDGLHRNEDVDRSRRKSGLDQRDGRVPERVELSPGVQERDDVLSPTFAELLNIGVKQHPAIQVLKIVP